MFSQIKVAIAAGIALLVAGLAAVAGYYRLKVAKKENEISTIKKDSLQSALDQLSDAQETVRRVEGEENDKAEKARKSAKRGDRSHFS